ncbi:putative nicotinic acid plasma membrane transporter protein [Cladophialophora carrionii]|uniref:Putative nicotinic acid plasma membrane transporter protein n=1 Tax=Cladophialophora carrionii TaxID=86049 RepID=A0A1C1D1F6_9EURO|nr:putative nicotinic acid plasma membrane transporter protein [Cladophialophora carrionii]
MPTSNSGENKVKPMAPSPNDKVGTLNAKGSQAEKALIRKLGLYIVPLIIISYVLTSLDRSNLGNAKIAGMPQDLHSHGNGINCLWHTSEIVAPSLLLMSLGVVSVFYATCDFFEMPITLLVKPLGPCNSKIAKRAAAVCIAVTLSGAFGGLFAWALTQIDGVPGYAGWRWICFVKGTISSCLAGASLFLFPNAPETARFLNPDEKRPARFLAQFRIESQDKDVPFRWSQVVAALKSLICWFSGFIQLCAGVYYHPLSIFLPTILTGLDYGSLETRYLTIPVYLFATVMVFFFAGLADRTQRRAPIMLFFSLFTIAGYAILLSWETPAGVKYFACFLSVGFGNVLLLLNIAWLNGNIGPRYKRATALTFNQTIHNIGSIIGGQIILDRESPRYRTGQAIAISCCGLGCIWSDDSVVAPEVEECT